MEKISWDGEDYSQHSGEQKRWGYELIEKLQLTGTEDILDLGCGDGKLTAKLADLLPCGTATGADKSEDMIGYAEKTYKKKNLRYEIADASDLKYKERFDVVYSNAALHWIKDHRPVVEGIYRALKAEGRILLQMGGFENAKDVFSLLEEMMEEKTWKGYFKGYQNPFGFYKDTEYRKILEDAGFKTERCQLIEKDMVHKDAEEFKGWIRTTWHPFTQRIPENRREEYIDEVTRRYLEKHPIDREGIHIKMIRLEVEAKK